MLKKYGMVAAGLILGSFAGSALGQDAPDLQKEEKFHSIYKAYNEQPTSEEVWEHAVGNRQSQVYRVQKGDTLSDISRTLFGDQFYWPKIWSFNTGDITNPHEISPNMNIQFFPGNMSDAPTLNMVDAQSQPEAAPAADSAEEGPAPSALKVAKAETFLLPPGRKSRSRPLHNLPPSLPTHRFEPIPKPSLIVDVAPTHFPRGMENLTYAVSNQAPSSIGKIVDTELGMKTAGDFQYVIIHLDDTSQKNLVVFRELEGVVDPTRPEPETKAHLTEYQGELEVLDKVNDGENLYRAMVKKTIQPVEVGAVLKAGTLPMFDPTPGEVTTGVKAVIIGGQFSNKRNLIGSRSLVFLSAGSGQGLQEGQSLAVFGNLRKRLPNTKVQMNARQIGVVKIVNLSQNYATAYLTQTDDDISVGDFVGGSTAVASALGEASSAGVSSSKDELDEFMNEPAPDTKAAPNEIPDFKDEDPLSGSSGDDSDFDF